MSSNIGINSNSRLFVCYFCNREIKGETELGHTAVCGSVLIPCPNKCGVYTPRSDVASHCQKCPNKMTKRKNLMQSSLNSSTISIPDANSNNSQWSTSVPKTDIAIVGELKSLQNRCSIVEQYLNNLSIFNKNKTFVDSKEVDRLIIQMRILEEWRDIVNLKLENIRQQITQQELIKSETKDNWSKLRQYLLVFEKFKIDVSNIKETISREQNLNKQQYAEWNQKLTSLKQNMDEQTSLLMSLLEANEANISKIMNSISEMQKPLEELSSKFIALNFDVKALTRISTDAVERLEMQQRDFDAIKKEFDQMKIDLEILEEKPDNLIYSKGRLVWKIGNFETRMKKSKENGTVIRSPVFYTHEFGYKIRALIYLNGLNKWKNRYSLICLHVIKGEYDLILKWPCNIEGYVTLRDIENFENPKNVTKFITAKRNAPGEENEAPQESSSTYIFIPHGTLMKTIYMKEDTLFLDIRINHNEKLARETDL